MIFRKVALERLSSPEQLDQLLQVTNPQGWMALGALGLILLTSIGWGVFGSIPTEASGEGILLGRQGVANIVAPENGQLEELVVAVGDFIEKGQVVARIRQEDLSRQVQQSREKLADARRQFEELQRFAGAQKELKGRELSQKRANLERTIEAAEREIKNLEDRIAADQALLADGLVTKQTVLASEQSLNQARERLNSARLERDGLGLQQLESKQQLDQQIEASKGLIRDLELELREREARLGEAAKVTAPSAGRVLELLVAQGDVVTPGTPILNLEVPSKDLMAVLFIPAAAGKKVHRGMAARITPSTVKREEYGFIRGRVVEVAEFPSTQRGMVRTLGNEALVQKLMTEGPPIQIRIALDPDPATPTGYRWSSSTGPSVRISSGTLAGGSVVVREERPLSLVLPKVREKLGI
jgi:HlyD family secretion protein